MKKLLFAGIAAAGVLGGSLGTASVAAAGPAGTGDANAVINDLKANGYQVIITKSGAGDLSKCTVKSVQQQSAVYDVQSARDIRNSPTSVPVLNRKIATVALSC